MDESDGEDMYAFGGGGCSNIGIPREPVLPGRNVPQQRRRGQMTLGDYSHELAQLHVSDNEEGPEAVSTAKVFPPMEKVHLPVREYRKEILKHIKHHRVTCIHGDTGCGKSTGIPQFIIDHEDRKYQKSGQHLDSRLRHGSQLNIIVTQPRRMAAVALAKRVSAERGQEVGETVGYIIGGDSKVSDQTRITYVTAGYLLQHLINNPDKFEKYTHIILDEIHERNIDADLLSLVTKLMMQKQEDVTNGCANYPKIIVMSATLQGTLFSRYFNDMDDDNGESLKPLYVGAKLFPVDEVYLEDLLNKPTYLTMLNAANVQSVAKAVGTFNKLIPKLTDNEEKRVEELQKSAKSRQRGLHTANQDFTLDVEDDPDLRRLKPISEQAADASSTVLTGTVGAMLTPEIKAGIQLTVSLQTMGQLPFERRTKPDLMKGLDKVCAELVKGLAVPGETILIFLPGIVEIQTLHDTLVDREEDQGSGCPIKIFVLHSQVPREDQESVLDPGFTSYASIVLATNIAESSLTIPKVRYVIDFGLKRQIFHDAKKRMKYLMKTWVSKASGNQRKGCTGREFEGCVIRLYTKYFFDHCIEDFDSPEMETAPLDMLLLRVKFLGRKIDTDKSPYELLRMSVSPPSVTTFQETIKFLADTGALLAPDQHADMSLLGLVAIKLPIDLLMCRLVLYGIIMGCTCDAVIMAAAMSLYQEPFTLPSLMIMKDPSKFSASIHRSSASRFKYDDGEYSEPIMFLNMFKAWLKKWQNKPRDMPGKKARKMFCYENALSEQRLIEMEQSVAEISSRLYPFLNEHWGAQEKLKQLMVALKVQPPEDYHYKWEDNGRNAKHQEGGSKPADIMEVFIEDMNLLKCLIVAAFSPHFLLGTTKSGFITTKKGLVDKQHKVVEALNDDNFDETRSIVSQVTPSILKDDRSQLEKSLKLIFPVNFPENHAILADGRLHLQFAVNPEQKRHVVNDIPYAGHMFNQYGEGRDNIRVPGLNQQARRGPPAMFKRITQPYRLHWEFLQEKSDIFGTPISATVNGWRNPVGFVCDTLNNSYLAVAAMVQGCEDPKKVRVEGVTMLPLSALSLAMVLTFYPQHLKLKFGAQLLVVNKIKFLRKEFPLGDMPISLGALNKINDLRHMISRTFVCNMDQFSIPDANIGPDLQDLFQIVKSTKPFKRHQYPTKWFSPLIDSAGDVTSDSSSSDYDTSDDDDDDDDGNFSDATSLPLLGVNGTQTFLQSYNLTKMAGHPR